MSDIIIIGGGIAGLTSAAHLAPHAKVTLFEREDQLAYHASGRSAAMYLACYGKPAVRALNDASGDVHRAAGVLSPRGMLKLGAKGKESILTEEAADLGMDLVDLDFAASKFPILNRDTVSRAAWLEDAFALDTDKLLQHFQRQARAHGAEILTKRPVEKITKSGKWNVTAGGETYEADIIINAAGAWVDHIAEMASIPRLGFRPFRRSIAVIPPPGGRDVSAWPFTESAQETWYAKPEGGRLAISPSEEDLVEPHDVYADDMVIAEGLARYEAMVTEPVTRVERSWAGIRTMSPDRCLVLGPDPADPSFVWCAGQGGYGFQSAPASGQLIADHVLGRAPQLGKAAADTLNPARFR